MIVVSFMEGHKAPEVLLKKWSGRLYTYIT